MNIRSCTSSALLLLALIVSAFCGNGGAKVTPEMLSAIRTVESDNGATSSNLLQIRPICIRDVNRIYGTRYTMADAKIRYKADRICVLYLTYWGRQKYGSRCTEKNLIRIWNGGPDGNRKPKTLEYYTKVKRYLSRR